MAIVLPIIDIQGKTVEHVTLLEPRDFMFFHVENYDQWVKVKDSHTTVGTLEQLEEQLREERRHVFTPLPDSIENAILIAEPEWAKGVDVGVLARRYVQDSCWTNWTLKVDPKGTYGLTLGCAWAEALKLWTSAFWCPTYTQVTWTRLWEEKQWAVV